MLQVIKSDSCRILAIFFQCCFTIETQVLMTVSNFSGIFSRNHFLEGGFTFQWGGGGGTHFDWGFKRKLQDGGGTPHAPPLPHYGKPWAYIQHLQCSAKFLIFNYYVLPPCANMFLKNPFKKFLATCKNKIKNYFISIYQNFPPGLLLFCKLQNKTFLNFVKFL